MSGEWRHLNLERNVSKWPRGLAYKLRKSLGLKILGEVLYCSGKIWLPLNNVCEARIKISANDIRRVKLEVIFQVKACVSVAGSTKVGKVGVSACSNVNKSEISKASRMSTGEKRFVKGGKRETNNKLANGATSVELIDQLMYEADEFPASVQHTFRAIWTVQ